MVTSKLESMYFMVMLSSLVEITFKLKKIIIRNTTVLNSKYILIATGAKPMNLNILGSENIITSDDFLEFSEDRLPDRIVFVGGGYISFEFAHIAARAGVKKITILHRGKQPLEHFDPDLVNQLIQRSTRCRNKRSTWKNSQENRKAV